MSESTLADLPEAIPLKRVSPVWRLLAIFTAIVSVLCLIGILLMAFVIQGLRMQVAMGSWAAAPTYAPAVVTGPTTAIKADTSDDDDAPPVQAGTLPYPIQNDLKRTVSGRDPDAIEAPPSARDRFLRKGQDMWNLPRKYTAPVVVSPDGQSIATFHGYQLIVGNPKSPDAIEISPDASAPATGGAVAWRGGAKAWRGAPVVQPEARTDAENRPTGVPVWSSDGRYVYFATIAGCMGRYDVQKSSLEPLPFRGTWPMPLPNKSRRLVFVRSKPAPKADTPGAPATMDPQEIVIGDLQSKTVRVVASLEKRSWTYPAVSPDGKQLAAWASAPGEDAVVVSELRRVFLANGKSERLGDVHTTAPGPICWAPDGEAVIYERGLSMPLPPDCLADDPQQSCAHTTGLFQWDIAKKAETRLSRGAGFASPSIGTDGSLSYLAWKAANSRATRRLRQMKLTTARELAAAAPELPPRSADAWNDLLGQVCREAKLPDDPAQVRLTPELLTQVANGFAKLYEERFQEKAPTDTDGFRREMSEIRALQLPPVAVQRCLMILGVFWGEQLRTKHGAAWHIVDGPIQLHDTAGAGSPFVQVVNLFHIVDRSMAPRDEDEPPSLETLLRQAEGRPLLLTNASAGLRAAVDQRADADLAHGIDLLQQGKSAEAEGIFEAMLRREAHRRNYHLALVVGRQLYDHKRLTVLQKLMEKLCAQEPTDAQKFNLLGLALMDRDPRDAVNAFQKALRCDLRYGPAYLNLAQAYRQANDSPAAIACLRRYLELLPRGAFAADAGQRLTALEGKE